MSTPFSQDLLAWYEENARELPWRTTHDPYAIWISEIMLQQTRVETVIPYYQRWMAAFPTIGELARAGIDEILSLWEGLGYYQRAHNVHRAAKLLVEEYGAELPVSKADLEKLPGIGPYTAAAISSIAFGEKEVALDGNQRRIISRLIDYDRVANTPQAATRFQSWASEHLLVSPSEFNQAMMDLGASICTAKAPDCDNCPVSSHCEAYSQGTQEVRPVTKPRLSIPHHLVSAGVLRKAGKVLIGRRPAGSLLGGLWEFPGGKCRPEESIEECLVREWKEELELDVLPGSQIGVIDHAYTHFKVTVHALRCEVKAGVPVAKVHTELAWVDIDNLKEYPMGKVDRSIASLINV